MHGATMSNYAKSTRPEFGIYGDGPWFAAFWTDEKGLRHERIYDATTIVSLGGVRDGVGCVIHFTNGDSEIIPRIDATEMASHVHRALGLRDIEIHFP